MRQAQGTRLLLRLRAQGLPGAGAGARARGGAGVCPRARPAGLGCSPGSAGVPEQRASRAAKWKWRAGLKTPVEREGPTAPRSLQERVRRGTA